MISDESSSDSETGRFKCTESKAKPKSNDHEKDLKFGGRSSGRGRPDNDRFRREFDRRRDDRERVERRSRDRQSNRSSRYSPPRRRSRERSRDRSRRSRDRHRSRDKEPSSRPKPAAPPSKERKRISPPRVQKSPVKKKDYKDEERPGKYDRGRSRDKSLSLSPDQKVKRSVVQKPVQEAPKQKVESPIHIDDHESDDEVQPGSYYSMIPAVVKEKSVEREKTEESSEIDSSDDERLRAKLLNLEKELSKTRKKKHRKKHKKKSSRSKDKESDVSVEVSSTTDIGKDPAADSKDKTEVEVSSTQKGAQKDSSEEGELSSDDNSKGSVAIDATDLRHRLKRSQASEASGSPDLRDRLKSKPDAVDVCGPALPPHLEKRFSKSVSPGLEGPALPPQLTRAEKNIGPTIPQDVRKALAEAEMKPIKCDSSEDEDGIGPLPAGAEQKWTDAHKRLEERALDIKIKKMDGSSQQSDVKSREKWMLELPQGKAKILGLEARSFRAKEGPDMSDRSSWTDTPEQKALKAAGVAPVDTAEALAEDARARIIAKRDEEQDKAARKHKKKHKREESLLDIHQKKLKKKKKKDDKDEKSERRPFSRDVDLQVNRFDEAQKKSIIKKAQELDTRFSKGQAKYL